MQTKTRVIQDSQLSLPHVTWSQFELVESSFSDIGGVKFIYLDGVLEIMSPSPEHEDYKSSIGLLLEAYMRESSIRFYTRGSATLGNKEFGVRKEPDESYNFGIKKSIPDLVIEVILTSGSIDLLQLYQRLNVPEVWLWQDGNLQVFSLQGNYESYEKIARSQFLPNLDLKILAKYINYYDQYDAAIEFIKELNA